MRVLTDPAETGAVTLALPQDVQAEAFDWPDASPNACGTSTGRRPTARAHRAPALIASAQRPLIVAGGGVIYSGATEALARLAEGPASRWRDAGGEGLAALRPPAGGRGDRRDRHHRGQRAGREADLVIGIGTRWSDFTTASRTAFDDPGVRFVNINVARLDAAKHSGLAVVADARDALDALARLAATPSTPPYRDGRGSRGSGTTGRAAYQLDADAARSTQSEVIGLVNTPSGRATWWSAPRVDAGRPAQAVAGPRPEGLPRRVRLLLHGL